MFGRLRAVPEEEGPALHCDEVKNLDLSGLRAAEIDSGEPVIRVRQTRPALLPGCTAPPGAF